MPAAAPPRPARALDEAIRAIPSGWFRPSRAIYWTDMCASALVGWGALGAAVASAGWSRAALVAVATFALYRAVLFIHEITHLAPRDVPMFTFAWNAIVGVPLLMPSFLYEGVHTDHHRQRCYGTDADPEYVPYGRQRPIVMVLAVAASILAPIVFAVRFGIIAPLAWLAPALRRVTDARASALVINTGYVRHAPISFGGRVEEAGACAVVWITTWLYATSRIPIALIACWAAASAAASLINAVRTLAAHRYDNESDELTMVEQLLDSCTLAPRRRLEAWMIDAGHALVAPVGLRYHALHHWIPSLPYHNLGRAHRRLMASISGEAPYRSTIAAGLTPLIKDLLRRARTQS